MDTPPEVSTDAYARGQARARAAAQNDESAPLGAPSPETNPAGDRTDADTVAPLRRHRRTYRPTPTLFVDAGADLAAVIDAHAGAADRVFLCGPRPGNSRSGMTAWSRGDLPAGWAPAPAGHYDNGPNPVFRFVRDDGAPFEVRRAASWFGEGEWCTADAANAAWVELADTLAESFDGGALLASPSATGRDLWIRSIPFDHPGWVPMSRSMRELVSHTARQGRRELVATPGTELAALYEYDARFSYAALCRELPAGEPSYDHRDAFEGYTRARYRATWTVPRDWDRPFGLLGHVNGDGSLEWVHEPGATATGWVDGCELMIALAQRWPVRIVQRLVWEPYRGRGPLDTWAEKLIVLRQSARNPLVAAAVRAITLHTIGAFASTGHPTSHQSDDIDAIPEHADNWRVIDGTHHWTEDTGHAWPEMAHPEWTAAIWARARARLLGSVRHRGALRAEGNVVAFWTDAIWTDTEQGWPDTGQAGQFRQATAIAGPLVVPADTEGLHAMKVASRRG